MTSMLFIRFWLHALKGTLFGAKKLLRTLGCGLFREVLIQSPFAQFLMRPASHLGAEVQAAMCRSVGKRNRRTLPLLPFAQVRKSARTGLTGRRPLKIDVSPKGLFGVEKNIFSSRATFIGGICNALLFSQQASGSATPTPVTPMTLGTLVDKEPAERGPSPHGHHAVLDAVQEQATETNYNSQHS